MSDEFNLYKRNLPHWRNNNAIYFVTWRLHKAQAPLTGEERTIVVSALKYFNGNRYAIIAYVVMDDHVHVLVRPTGGYLLSQILHSWKSFSVRQLQKDGERERMIWQDESFDRIVRDEKELLEIIKYIAGNPASRWPDITVYLWGQVLEDWD